ncbi:hypothetical protein SAMN02745116_01035 [Pilibacter termitis]|uniref:Uncharacterized protein n=1 Tax=Pilibacter termitis TaxID=263852 RepID=A0A1T4MCE8_9ENTE|nr:hypothetical protein [Pilibacter termitis]SJZ64404.1 hypothetical protein SAMN02745116_01035 [Pilibacter termitis]
MPQAIRLDGNIQDREIVVLSKKEYDSMEQENKRLKAELRLSQELQKPLISLINGNVSKWEDVRDKLWGKEYE